MSHLRLACLVALLAAVRAMHEDQIRLQDWSRRGLGDLRTATARGKTLLVATHDNVLAGLQLRSGAISWRTVLPEESHIAAVRFGPTAAAVADRTRGSVSFFRTVDGAPLGTVDVAGALASGRAALDDADDEALDLDAAAQEPFASVPLVSMDLDLLGGSDGAVVVAGSAVLALPTPSRARGGGSAPRWIWRAPSDVLLVRAAAGPAAGVVTVAGLVGVSTAAPGASFVEAAGMVMVVLDATTGDVLHEARDLFTGAPKRVAVESLALLATDLDAQDATEAGLVFVALTDCAAGACAELSGLPLAGARWHQTVASTCGGLGQASAQPLAGHAALSTGAALLDPARRAACLLRPTGGGSGVAVVEEVSPAEACAVVDGAALPGPAANPRASPTLVCAAAEAGGVAVTASAGPLAGAWAASGEGAEERGAVTALAALPFASKGSAASTGLRVLVRRADGAWQALQKSGPAWTREESLAAVETAQFALRPPIAAAHTLHAHADAGAGAAGAAVEGPSRWASQAMELVSAVAAVRDLPLAVARALMGDPTLGRGASGKDSGAAPRGGETAAAVAAVSVADEGARAPDDAAAQSVLLLTTRAGRVWALEAASGAPLWSLYLPGRTRVVAQPADPDAPSQEVLLLTVPSVGAGAGAGVATWVALSSGAVEDRVALPAGARLAVALPCPAHHCDSAAAPVALLVLPGGAEAVAVPDTAEARGLVAELAGSLVFHVADETEGVLSGYRIRPLAASAGGHRFPLERLWSLRVAYPSDGSRLVAVAARPAEDRLQSVGQPEQDGSVTLKYFNPHLVAAVAESAEGLTLVLADAVTGRVLLSQLVAHAASPATVTLSEHWAVLTYWNGASLRSEALVAALAGGVVGPTELFPLRVPESVSDELFSSHADPGPVVTQAVFVLSEGVRAAGAVATGRGIAAKHLLVATGAGRLVSVDRRMLDPRRPQGSQGVKAAQEAGVVDVLPPYSPVVPLLGPSALSYNLTIARPIGLTSGPTSLESTSLVFTHGLDLFFAPAHPSGTFDRLPDSFNYPMLLLLLVGLSVAAVVTTTLKRRKALNQAWA